MKSAISFALSAFLFLNAEGFSKAPASQRNVMMAATYAPPYAKQMKESPYPAVVSFGKGHTSSQIPEGIAKSILGGKGANLGKMSEMGLSVPPGFTITTDICAAYQDSDKKLSKEVWTSVLSALKTLEKDSGKTFGGVDSPLLLSVRSGAAISMPGMMDTVLNLGLNDETIIGMSKLAGERSALDSYRRLLNMFGEVVLNIPASAFEHELTAVKAEAKVQEDHQLEPKHLQAVINKYKAVYEKFGKKFPQNPLEQLHLCISAVFDSWGSDRCKTYREVEKISNADVKGTAVNVQAMVKPDHPSIMC
jgi:pyruvate, orthophosphate dikinase